MPRLTVADLQKIKEKYKADFTLRESGYTAKIIVHMGTCGIAAGARNIMTAVMVQLCGITYPVYRIFILICAIVVGPAMALILFRTRLGIILRAAVNDSEMVNALGFNVPLVFTGVFAFGAALSGLAGVIAGPLLHHLPRHGG